MLAAQGHRAAVPLIREALDGAGEALWTRHPALAVTLAAELWDPHTHATIIEWLMKNGRESGSPLVLRLGLAQAASGAALAGDLDRAMAAIAEEEAIADATGAPRSPTTGCSWRRCAAAARRRSRCSGPPRQRPRRRAWGSWSPTSTGPGRCCTTAWPTTGPRWPRPGGPSPTGTSSSPGSPCPSWWRPPCGAASAKRRPRRWRR
ncbi:hypothetical protein HFP72_30575 [Nocardiopsis sp. ARC36]